MTVVYNAFEPDMDPPRNDQAAASRYPARFYVRLVVSNFPHRGGRWDNVSMQVIDPDGHKRLSVEEMGSYGTAAYMSDYYAVDQANRLREWIVERYGPNIESATVEEVDVDWVEGHDGQLLPTGWIPAGGGTDFYMFSDEDDYPLPFGAWGYHYLYDGVAVYRDDEKTPSGV